MRGQRQSAGLFRLFQSMSEPSPNSLVNLLEKSGVVDSDSLKASVTELKEKAIAAGKAITTSSLVCLLYTSPSPRDKRQSRMPSSA